MNHKPHQKKTPSSLLFTCCYVKDPRYLIDSHGKEQKNIVVHNIAHTQHAIKYKICKSIIYKIPNLKTYVCILTL